MVVEEELKLKKAGTCDEVRLQVFIFQELGVGQNAQKECAEDLTCQSLAAALHIEANLVTCGGSVHIRVRHGYLGTVSGGGGQLNNSGENDAVLRLDRSGGEVGVGVNHKSAGVVRLGGFLDRPLDSVLGRGSHNDHVDPIILSLTIRGRGLEVDNHREELGVVHELIDIRGLNSAQANSTE